jgi:hypothetical protein
MIEPIKPAHTVGGKVRVAIIKKVLAIIFKPKPKKHTSY